MSSPAWLQRGQRSSGDCHLGDLLHDYVDDALPSEQAHRADQHLLVCAMCRAEVEQERALVARLRGFRPDPQRHQDLVAGLLGLADRACAPQPRPAVQQGPGLVTRGAPAQYQSARHSLAAALVAVMGCTGVGLVVATAPSRTSTPPRTPNPQVATPTQAAPNSLGLAAAGRTSTVRAQQQTFRPAAGPAAVVRLP